jgi:uncharacterized protein YjiS (DUF1127 family)
MRPRVHITDVYVLKGKTMFASLTLSTMAVSHVQKRGSALGTLRGLSEKLNVMLVTAGQRRQLARLDDAALADIGLSRAAALTEAARPAWDLPATLRR